MRVRKFRNGIESEDRGFRCREVEGSGAEKNTETGTSLYSIHLGLRLPSVLSANHQSKR